MLELFVTIQTRIADRTSQVEEQGATAVEYALMVGLTATKSPTTPCLMPRCCRCATGP